MDARFMQIHNLVLTREVIINSMFPVDRMRELNFHRETAVHDSGSSEGSALDSIHQNHLGREGLRWNI